MYQTKEVNAVSCLLEQEANPAAPPLATNFISEDQDLNESDGEEGNDEDSEDAEGGEGADSRSRTIY
jgi:hypothetical protein